MENEFFADKAGVIIFPPLLYFLTLLVGLLLSYFFPYHLLENGIAVFIGLSITLFSFLILRKAVRQLNKHKTTINPSGKTTSIVSEGIYKYTRNPMYISFTLFHIGISIAFNSWLSFLLLVPLLPLVQKGIIGKEEKYLTQKFGEEYLMYKSMVPRWF
jgi:protein-S-isoprenylcysteine O-methyltransferase Ste14